METLSGILLVTSMLVFFVGLIGFLMPRWVKQPDRNGVILKILLPSIIAFSIGVVLLPKPEQTKAGNTKAPMPEPTAGPVEKPAPEPVSEPAPEPVSEPVPESVSEPVSKISFKEIRHKMEGMTELQFDEYGKTLKGKRIRWSGYVEDVQEKFFGGYEVLVDVDSPNELMSVHDLKLDVSKEQAVALKKDGRITFEATISSVLSVLTMVSISFDEVKLINTASDISM